MELSDQYYRRKLYALLQALQPASGTGHKNSGNRDCSGESSAQNDIAFYGQVHCWGTNGIDEIEKWWRQAGPLAQNIAASSDRLNLQTNAKLPDEIDVRHPISGQRQAITELPLEPVEIPRDIRDSTNAKQVFWWFWRFYPEYWAKVNPNSQALLYPAHRILPDCPLHSYQSTVSALTGAMYPEGHSGDTPATPYLLLFSFSPVQEFIKASRKFVDFWAGSYLLHYLSARLCWHIAQKYGPDAVIVPSLWNQEIFDALMLQDDGFSSFEESFRAIAPEESKHKTPVERFNGRESNSLSTAGFPNMITVLVPGEEGAKQLGQELTEKLVEEWKTIGNKVRNQIRDRVISWLGSQDFDAIKTLLLKEAFPNSLEEAFPELSQDELQETFERLTPEAIEVNDTLRSCWREITKLQDPCAWHWPNLWEQQLSHSWEPYWAAVPLGSPKPLAEVSLSDLGAEAWIKAQQTIAFSPEGLEIPSPEEKQLYQSLENGRLNIGNWWGPLQQRLIVCLHAVKNTRNWQIPAAPGNRSTISGQFSAVHPWLKYHGSFREGGGLSASSMRLFWLVMLKAYPGLFDGSEQLNALEITKRMAWIYGGVAESLGIQVRRKIQRITQHQQASSRRFQWEQADRLLYEQFSRFPNVSSIAAARFIYDNPQKTRLYLDNLKTALAPMLSRRQQQVLRRVTQISATHIPKTDDQVNPQRHKRLYLNGVMFSSKWLAEDLGLERNELETLRGCIDDAHQATDFTQGSPHDWWVILLSDGDSMGQYVSGKKLGVYEKYLVEDAIAPSIDRQLLNSFRENTRKRMGPATHVGLNRALLDFSNRLVPYLTEKRYCGRVIYSGGDDVMATLPLEDLPGYLLSLRAAWSGKEDPYKNVSSEDHDDPVLRFEESGGYWQPVFRDGERSSVLPDRPHFTMGKDATMSSGIVFAHKSVPLPTVLESLWAAEGNRAKNMPGKNGICFRVIYGSGNQLEALMHGELLKTWWDWVSQYGDYKKLLSPVLYRLAEELPRRIGEIPEHPHLFSKAAKVLMEQRDENRQLAAFRQIENWLDEWEDWARGAQTQVRQQALEEGKSSEDADNLAKNTLGTRPEDLSKLLRFTAFWVDKRVERWQWTNKEDAQ